MNTLNSPPDGLETLDQIAARCQVSRRTVQHWVRKRKVPSVKIGQLTRFDWKMVHAALIRLDPAKSFVEPKKTPPAMTTEGETLNTTSETQSPVIADVNLTDEVRA